MCDSCGCGDARVIPFEVHERLLAANDRTAAHNREHFNDRHVFAVNLMGSPGCGKTALLEATARAVAERGEAMKIGVLAGDLATDNDAARIRAAGIVAESITTGTACHLDADMVHRGLHRLPWRTFDYLFIENVGNLVCPAVYDLGQHVNVVALSVTEGEDKPLKYPTMFRKADLVVLTKIDLLPQLPDISVDAIAHNLSIVMPRPAMLQLSSRSGLGVDEWIRWLRGQGRPRSAPCATGAGAFV
ncbi:MAG TPA: hydrogenase nickel incorporation protein HypB [Vicinamibacterales bacterium]|nr:hydrogenase nickel incorporation protein HypB [Vicinamibacterales bacterium]